MLVRIATSLLNEVSSFSSNPRNEVFQALNSSLYFSQLLLTRLKLSNEAVSTIQGFSSSWLKKSHFGADFFYFSCKFPAPK